MIRAVSILLMGAVSLALDGMPTMSRPTVITRAVAHDPYAAVTPSNTGGWLWPTSSMQIVTPFVLRDNPYEAGSHRGIDLVAPAGESVLAPASGSIAFAGDINRRGVITIDHGGGWMSSFEPVETLRNAGETVAAGAVIGIVSPDHGSCPDDCLHFGLRWHGDYVSPLLMLGYRYSVLLPIWDDPASGASGRTDNVSVPRIPGTSSSITRTTPPSLLR